MQTQIDHRHVVRLLGMGRVALGAAMLVAPRRSISAWVGPSSSDRGTQMAIRALGARDAVLGIGTIRALDRGDDDLAQWVTLSGLCDAADAAATLVAYRSLPRRGRFFSLVLAAGAAVTAFVARDRLA